MTSLDSHPLTRRIPFRISRLNNQLQAYARQTLKQEAGIGLSEWRMLIVLSTTAPCTAADIVRLTAMDKAQVSKTIKSLSQKGLVRQGAAHDGRRRLLSICELGQACIDKASPKMTAYRRQLERAISPEELEFFFNVIERLEELV